MIPPYLSAGDTIGITCPGGYFCLEDALPAIGALQDWGYQVKTGKTVDGQFYQYSGTDDERADDLQQMLDDPGIKAILFGRGGYGMIRIIDRINFNRFYLHPKWLVGYSDITVLHSHVHTQLHIPTMHAEMCIDLKYGTEDASAATIRKALRGDRLAYPVAGNDMNRTGRAAGLLVGGNLSLLAALAGSASDLDTDGKILFLEDVHEYLYHIDSMLYTLKRAGKLAFLAGLVVGGFTHLQEDEEIPFGQTAYQMILDKVQEYKYPVCFGFPAGHQCDNYTLKLGLQHELSVDATGAVLTELAI